MPAERRWQIELLPSARDGLMNILDEHGDDAFDQTLNDILASKRIPRRKTRNTFGKPRTVTGSTSTVHFTAQSTACFSRSGSCS